MKLEEFIDKCDPHFVALHKVPKLKSWRAVRLTPNHRQIDHWGTTPTEAVRSLYLAIKNEKS
jgi:hypothetical protein